MLLKTYSYKDLQTILKTFNVNFVNQLNIKEELSL